MASKTELEKPKDDTAAKPHTSATSAAPPSQFVIGVTLAIYCLSGTLLTLVNKLAVVAYPYPNALLVIQNGLTAVLLVLGSLMLPNVFGAMPSINRQVIKTWGPLVLMFVVMLFSSLQALMFVSATSLIVMRNLSTLVVAFFERLILGETIKPMTWFALVMILVGAVMFGARDMTFSVAGYIWLAVNVSGTSSYQIYVKKLIAQSKELGPFGMAFINNTLSLPVFILMSTYSGELPYVDEVLKRGAYTFGLVFLSGLLGFTLSTTAFMMNKMITATSMMVANNVNKFAVIVLSEVFVEKTLDDVSSVGTLMVIFFGWFYSKTKSSEISLTSCIPQALRRQYNQVPVTDDGTDDKTVSNKA